MSARELAPQPWRHRVRRGEAAWSQYVTTRGAQNLRARSAYRRTRSPAESSLDAQGLHGIEMRGAGGGHPCGDERDSGQDDGHGDEDRGVVGFDAVEEAGDEAGES